VRSSHGPAPQRVDRGFTIVENLLAIVLTGFIATSLFFAIWTLVRVSSINDRQADIEAVLGSSVDAMASVDYQPCPGLDGYESYAQKGAASVGWPVNSVQITNIRYWDPYSTTWTSTNPLSADDCSGLSFLSTARSMQLVEITATMPSGGYTRSIQTIVTDLREHTTGS
jgi:type II secretory pathway pseudopilin PulG